MKTIQEWINKKLVPVVNKITSLYWFGIIANAVLVHCSVLNGQCGICTLGCRPQVCALAD